MPVADHLAASHVAHLAYREALTRADAVTARTQLQAAYDARTLAQTEDPTFIDPEWATESGRYPHVQLLHFYREQLAR